MIEGCCLQFSSMGFAERKTDKALQLGWYVDNPAPIHVKFGLAVACQICYFWLERYIEIMSGLPIKP
jgi:hypothetical protein